MLPTDWALSSCLSLPSGSPWVVTAVRLKSTLAAAAAVTSGCEAAETAPEESALVAVMGLETGTVTVNTSPVAARATPAFCPTPLAAANSVIWRNGLRRPRRSSRCASRGRSAKTGAAGRGSGAGPVARRRPLAVWVVKTVPLWIACGVSCRIRVREIKDPARSSKHPGTEAPPGGVAGVGLPPTDFTPRLLRAAGSGSPAPARRRFCY